MDAGEALQAVLQHAQPHAALHHVHALQLQVVDGVQGRHAAGVGLGQSQQLLRCRGDGLAWRLVPEEEREDLVLLLRHLSFRGLNYIFF